MHEMKQWRGYGFRVNPFVFFVSAGLIVAFVAFGTIFTGATAQAVDAIQATIVTKLGWIYSLVVGALLVFVLAVLAVPKFRRLRLGPADSRPEYTYFSWFAMLFSAGMGIGLLFYGVAEPVLHYSNPPHTPGGTADAALEAMRLTFFHWGLHAWAIYIVVGMALAFFSYRHDLPLTIRSAFYPVLGERIYGIYGDLVDVLAVFGTMFGISTSLGLGVMQVNAGLAALGLVAEDIVNQLLLIAGITAVATVSVMSGLNKGIRLLSRFNLMAGLILLGFVLLIGPTFFIARALVGEIGAYLEDLVGLTLRTDAFHGIAWQRDWTLFYWGWWISWSPFVGMFIARVSRGRTVGGFITGVLLVPTMLTFVWMAVFGNAALHVELFGTGGMVAAVNDSVPGALYAFLDRLPLTPISQVLATVVIMGYFVTSSDSGSLIIDILTSGGDPDAPLGQRLFWALTEGAVAATLLVAGGLQALQTAALTTALPFSFVLVLMMVSLWRGLRADSAPETDHVSALAPARARPHEAHGAEPGHTASHAHNPAGE
ncbi:choline/glycine/proline betaine transport protein [Limimonas halophila]|uniref:Choline/glycine/proline betaine transport protein n=1 Tax=Limimonas halophila TaxID=1082479 RepID=A0A1G7QY34_9PROT|nr:BCCT family transporter [Limimonas halophila]SDG03407.1 choline/glycine/proline betaine transport protein [Limimonas halophila]